MTTVARGGLLGLLLVAAVLTTGCTHADKKADTKSAAREDLILWNTLDDRSVIFNLASSFTSETGQSVVIFDKPLPTIEADLLQALANGEGPDIVYLPSDLLRKHQERLVPAPTEVIDFELYRSAFIDPALSINLIDNQIFGVSLGFDTLKLFVNQKVLRAADKEYQEQFDGRPPIPEALADVASSWQILRDQVRLSTVKKGNFINRAGVALGTRTVIEPADVYAQLVLNNGGTLVRADHRAATFQVAESSGVQPGLSALDFYSSFSDPTHKNYSWNVGIGSPIERFAQDKLLYLFAYPEVEKELRAHNPDISLSIKELPRRDTKTTPVRLGRFFSYAVTKGSAQPEAAWNFLAFLADRAQAAEYRQATGRISTLRPGPDEPAPEEPVDYVVFIKGQQPEAVKEAVANMLDAASSSRQNLKPVLEAGADAVTKALQLETAALP